MDKEKFTLFYGGPFSQWFRCKFEVDGVQYCHAEQYMMAGKAALFGDETARDKIMKTSDPQQQKIHGRSVKGFDDATWKAAARDIVYRGNHAKFSQDEELRNVLLSTKGTTLVEASPTDQIWGIGLASYDSRAQNRICWRGTNWLGQVLTQVRDDLDVGVYRTEFNWDDVSVEVLPVRITNLIGERLWIWDNDKMRRQATDLPQINPQVAAVQITVEEAGSKFKVSLGAATRQATGWGTFAIADDVLPAFERAYFKLKEALLEPPK